MSIRLKLAIIFLAIGSLPLLFASIITFRHYKSTLEAEHLQQLKSISNFKAQTIESYFAGLRVDIRVAQDFYNIKKNLPVLAQFIDQPTRSEFITAKDTLDKQLRTMQEVLKLSSIILVNTEGKIIYTSNPQYYKDYFSNPLPDPGNKAFTEGKTKVYFSDIFFNKIRDNALEMLVAAPAFDEKGFFSGVIVFEVDMAPIYKLIQEGTSLGNTGEVLLGKAAGNQVVFLNPLRYDVNAALKRRVSVGEELGGPIQKAALGENGSGELIDYRGKKVIAAWRYIPSLGWGMVTKVDVREAFADVINLRNLVTVMLGIVLLLAGVASFSIAQSISGPIKELSKGAAIIGSGNLDYKVGTGSKDEIGQLSRVFDKMTRDLKRTGFARDAERQRLYSVLETLPVYVILLDKDYRVPFANKFFRERFGESGGKRCYEYLFNRSSPCENCETYKVMKTNAPHHWEWRGPDGRSYDIFDYPFVDSDGSRMIMEMGIDITEQKKAQADLAQAFQYARSLIEASLDPLVTISVDGAITDVNEATVKATGIPREKLIGTEFPNYFTEPQKAKAGYQKVFAKGFVTDYPLTIRHRDGTLMDVLYNASIYRDIHGNVLGVFAVARDVTLLKQTEIELRRHRDSLEVLVKERTAELQESRERLQHVLDAGEFGTWGLDTTTKKAWRSLRHDQIFG
ncbi:MAG: PAS domain S-box protein, partial [Candidatus Omnitrophica bacterium]|nr:PAS domain S-box protein [Candidatus Omnitrophota bacterium]